MKKIFLLVMGFCILASSFATIIPGHPRPVKASEIFLPVGITGIKISLLELSQIKIKDVEQFTGKKMSFGDRLKFKVAQKKLRDNIAPDGSFDMKRMNKAIMRSKGGGDGGFHLGGFALGFLLGPIGVLIAYLINDDNKQSRVRWAWKGFLAGVLIGIAIVAAGGGF